MLLVASVDGLELTIRSAPVIPRTWTETHSDLLELKSGRASFAIFEIDPADPDFVCEVGAVAIPSDLKLREMPRPTVSIDFVPCRNRRCFLPF